MAAGDTLEQEADQAAMRRDFATAEARLAELTHLAPGRVGAWIKLAAMRRAAGKAGEALAAVNGALAAAPLDFTGLLLRASLLEQLGDASAEEGYAHALAQRPQGDVPPGLAGIVAHAEQRAEQYLARRDAVMQAAAQPLIGALDIDQRARLDRLRSNALHRTRPYHSEPTHFHYPGLVEREFHGRSAFPWLVTLEAAADYIRREFEALVAAEHVELVPYVQYPDHQPLQQWRALNRSRDWTAIHLIQNGRRAEANAALCPTTMALLATLPQPVVPGCSPNAMFSLLAPGITIPPHVGVNNTRLVCHLPMIVPAGCWFRVGAETRPWREGEAFVFDDTIEHEAANPSAALRVVLIFDVWHPGLSLAERDAVAAIVAADGGGTVDSV